VKRDRALHVWACCWYSASDATVAVSAVVTPLIVSEPPGVSRLKVAVIWPPAARLTVTPLVPEAAVDDTAPSTERTWR
jgi:hypothetical protein